MVIVLPPYYLVLLRKPWFTCALCHFSSFSEGDFGVHIHYQMNLFICTAPQLWHWQVLDSFHVTALLSGQNAVTQRGGAVTHLQGVL